MQGLMECVSHIEERELNLILRNPGDTADAAESMVDYPRRRFHHTIFVPVARCQSLP